MATISKQTDSKTILPGNKQRNYSEIIEFLDKNWQTNVNDTTLSCVKKLDKLCGSPSQKVKTIAITGTNGKSLTANFATKLLQEEGLCVGTFYAPHILTYNERFHLNNETIANKQFTELANNVINAAEMAQLTPSSYEILTVMALVYFNEQNVDVALLEIPADAQQRATKLCTPSITAITRVTTDEVVPTEEKTYAIIETILSDVKPGMHVISADQSKINLQNMLELTEKKGGSWGMPIRKLAPLAYPFEQLHGRCAALAERIARVFVNTVASKDAIVVTDSLLTKQKGQRGRPTLEAKRQSELNPKKTMDQFWREVHNTLPGRFQLLDKEKPTLLLDNADNLDAFKNLLLGIRLLHYQRSLKGLCLIVGCNNQEIDSNEFLKLLRYFFKKTSGSVIFCPINPVPGQKTTMTWDAEKTAHNTKTMKIKARAAKSFKEAFQLARKSVDERNGLIVITGSSSIVSHYWAEKGVKKI